MVASVTRNQSVHAGETRKFCPGVFSSTAKWIPAQIASHVSQITTS
jgi:hypothetical protein